jgi:hypothetical protein
MHSLSFPPSFVVRCSPLLAFSPSLHLASIGPIQPAGTPSQSSTLFSYILVFLYQCSSF